MDLRKKLRVGLSLARVRVLGDRIPVAVRINLNNRCHSRCGYCSFWHTPSEEMSTDEVRRVVVDLARLGTQRLTLSGGEPMLRKDLGAIVDAAVDAGLSVDINSTGFLFDRRRDDLRRLDLVKLSIDGSPAVHDRIRGRPGSFRELEGAIEVARSLGLRFSFAFTMTRDALPEIPFVLDFARRHRTFVAFQPVMAHTHASADVRRTFPERADYLRAVDLLIAEKRRDGDVVRNSLGALEHIKPWPRISGLKCWGGEVFLMIEPNGDVVPCDRIDYAQPVPNCRERGVEWALARLPEKVCEGCGFCGAVEINMLMGLDPGSLPSIAKVVGGIKGAR